MGGSPPNVGLLRDVALVDPEDDELGYATFSEELSEFIQERVPTTTFVIGVYGDWGSGKSSILNFVEHNLSEYEDPPFIIRFNPWWFSGQEDLTGKYLDELETALATDEGFAELREKIHRFSALLSHVPSQATGGFPLAGVAKSVRNLTGKAPPTLTELKEDISNLLEETDRRIVVLIDDIDRLTKEEIRQMFRLVKSVADFPNVTYVLAFDHSVVIDALDGEQGHGRGEEYLNKIIQLPQHVPTPEEGALHALLLDRLSLLTENTDLHMDESRWQRVYAEGIFPIINTPRDVVRLSNSIHALHTRIGEEVNFVDLVAIEMLRIFYRPVFERIRDEKETFVLQQGRIDTGGDQFLFLDDLYDELDDNDEDQVKTIIGHLFPQYGTSADAYHVGDLGRFRRRKRICHPDIYPYFFRQTIPRGEVTTADMASMLNLTDDPEAFADELRAYTQQEGKQGRSRATTFVRRFEDRLDEVKYDHVGDVLSAFFLVGDELVSEDPSESMLDDGIEGPLLRAIWNLVKRIDPDTRHEQLKAAIERGSSIYLPFYFIGVMMQEHGKYEGEEKEEEDQTLSRDQIETLQEITVQKAEELAESGDLLQAPKLSFVLARWHEWGDEERVRDWAASTFDDDGNLLALLESMVQVGRQSSRTRVSRVEYIDPTRVEPFLDVSNVRSRVEDIDTDGLEESERHVVELFEDGLERMDSGMDPGDFGSWSIAEVREGSSPGDSDSS